MLYKVTEKLIYISVLVKLNLSLFCLVKIECLKSKIIYMLVILKIAI